MQTSVYAHPTTSRSRLPRMGGMAYHTMQQWQHDHVRGAATPAFRCTKEALVTLRGNSLPFQFEIHVLMYQEAVGRPIISMSLEMKMCVLRT